MSSERKKKIQKWEEEIASIQKSKEEFDLRCTNKIKELRQKIEQETRQLKTENDQLIADAVRAIYGEVSEENIAEFKALIADAKQLSS